MEKNEECSFDLKVYVSCVQKRRIHKYIHIYVIYVQLPLIKPQVRTFIIICYQAQSQPNKRNEYEQARSRFRSQYEDCTFCTGVLLCFHKFYLIQTIEHNSFQHLQSILHVETHTHTRIYSCSFRIFVSFCSLLFSALLFFLEILFCSISYSSSCTIHIKIYI